MAEATPQTPPSLDEVRARIDAIDDAEAAMDTHLFELYALTPQERFLVEKDRARRGGT